MPEHISSDPKAETVSEAEFSKLCTRIYEDREQIYSFNPSAAPGEALLWMLLGCLISLLSVPPAEQPDLEAISSPDPYADAVREILRNRMQPPFDPEPHLSILTTEAEDR